MTRSTDAVPEVRPGVDGVIEAMPCPQAAQNACRGAWPLRTIPWPLGALAVAVTSSGSALAAGPLHAVSVESVYADVIAQIGGRYVQVTAIETDPNTNPHSFEASPAIARAIAAANLIVSNGVGYDSWAERILSAAPSAKRRVIDVQRLLGLPDSAPNPHLWYQPKTMPAVANAVATALCLVALLALGTLFLSMTREYSQGVYALLFGEVLGIGTDQILPVVGALLVFSLMTGPASAARSLTDRPLVAALLSSCIAVLTVWVAIALSNLSNWPVGFSVGALGVVSYLSGRMYRRYGRRVIGDSPALCSIYRHHSCDML